MTGKPKSTFARRVRAAKSRDKHFAVRDDIVQGLILRVFPSGARTFAFDSMVRGLRRYATLGRADSMTIPEARREARILPTFGKMPLDRIDPEDVAAWFDAASKDKPGAANRALEILRSMMFRAEEWGLRECDSNPCLGIKKNPRRKLARFLDTDELARLGITLDAHWPEAVPTEF